jgi:SAM-dependent methyltransferase
MKEWGEHEAIVEKLVQECPSFTSILKVKDLSGRSGAQTFLVQPQSVDGTPLAAILKIGPAAIIKKDLDGLERIKHLVRYANYKLADVMECDVRAVLLQLAGGQNCRSFEEYYLDSGTTPDSLSKCVARLFDGILRVDTRNLQRRTNPFAQYTFHAPDRQSRALRDLGDRLPTSIRWWERASSKSHGFEAHTMLCHGDLHRKNILVCGQDAFVIDFGLLGAGHAPRDFAKLERDILLFLYPVESEDYNAQADFLPKADFDTEQHHGRGVFIHKAQAGIEAIRTASRPLINNNTWLFQYEIALLAQMIFAATDEGLGRKIRVLALTYARILQERLEKQHADLKMLELDRRNAYRKDALWRFAYAFLRLDQLPSGGWGKSLPGWFEALVEGDNNSISRSPETRTKGGTDLTVYGFIEYLRFQARLSNLTGVTLSERIKTLHTDSFSAVTDGVWGNLKKRIGWDGGIDTGHGRAQDSPSVRHTTIGLIGFLIYSRFTGNTPVDEIKTTSEYLRNHIEMWREDKTHLFGSYCALTKLKELLGEPPQEFSDLVPADLASRVDKVLHEMATTLNLPHDIYTLKPAGTFEGHSGDFSLRPYADFWRMERSNLLMHMPFLLTESHAEFHKFVDARVQERCLNLLREILRESSMDGRVAQLCFYYRDSAVNPLYRGNNRPSDWGLTAELLTLVSSPGVRDLGSKNGDFWDGLPDPDQLIHALTSSLLASFDQYQTHPSLFKFTHATSFARYLLTVDHDIFNIDAVRGLDRHIEASATAGNTESSLHHLCEALSKDVCGEAFQPDKLINIAAMRDLLVDKLEGGEHVHAVKDWDRRVEHAKATTIEFFDGEGGLKYAEYYSRDENVVNTLVTRISDVVSWPRGTGKKHALDVGCGPGQYAKLLMSHGFSVELLDASKQMLEKARALLQEDVAPPEPRTLADLANQRLYEAHYFDLIFACAIMVHVPRAEVPGVLKSMYRILRPGGALFVNFKIGDHTLLGVGMENENDERYFEYYRDHSVPWIMLEESGFAIHELTLRWNRKTMYRDPKRIHWANFYCTKQTTDS